MSNKKRKSQPSVMKQARSAFSPSAQKKTARRSEDPGSTNAMQPVWVFAAMDEGGPWGRKLLTESAIWDDILPKMRNFESMTWSQIELDRKRNHSIPISDLCKEAQKRIEVISLDVDELFRFRLTGEQRLWGVRDRNRFKLLWWDPEHKVCPSQKRNT
jgi:hypothetical protein